MPHSKKPILRDDFPTKGSWDLLKKRAVYMLLLAGESVDAVCEKVNASRSDLEKEIEAIPSPIEEPEYKTMDISALFPEGAYMDDRDICQAIDCPDPALRLKVYGMFGVRVSNNDLKDYFFRAADSYLRNSKKDK